MNEVDPFIVESILSHGKERLLRTVPTGKILCTSYNDAQQLDWKWYMLVIGLSENLTNSRKRAKLHGMDNNLTLHFLVELWIQQRGRCAMTHKVMCWKSGSLHDKNYLRMSVDRIDNSIGYVQGNVRLLTHWANNAKSTWPEEVFLQMIDASYQKIKQETCSYA